GSWTYGSVWNIPNTIGVDNSTIIDWNIAEVNNTLSLNRDAKLLGLLVNSGGLLNVNGTTTLTTDSNSSGTGNGLFVSHYLYLDGKIDLQGESQLLQKRFNNQQVSESILDPLGLGVIERDQQGMSNTYRYNDWSSPVQQVFSGSSYTIPGNNTFNISGVLRDGTDPNNPKPITFIYGLNGDDSSSPIKITNRWIYIYADFTHDDYWSWYSVNNLTELKVGEGFLMKGASAPGKLDQNYVFVGRPNNGDISLPLSGDNDYLVGNPYPAAIDADQFILDNQGAITGELLFWDHHGGNSHNLRDYEAGWAIYNMSGGIQAATPAEWTNQSAFGTKVPGRYIAVGQAFNVQGANNGAQYVKFNNEQKQFITENSGESVFFKNSAKNNTVLKSYVDDRAKLRLNFNSQKTNKELLLTIDERATSDVDYGFDAEVYEGTEDDIYWMIEDRRFVIQGRDNMAIDTEIPLGITMQEADSIKIELSSLENFENLSQVYIKDNLDGETYEITNKPFITYLDSGDYLERFSIVFQPRLLMLSEMSAKDGVYIFMDNQASELKVRKIVDVDIKKISIYNTIGQLMTYWDKKINNRTVSVSVNLANGVYIVKVDTNGGVISKKIVVK
ncbi:MAG TPA: T9SS type A sorting domain-containing protein, partial [Flavobacteriaceae bacterium]|nr:T9SS type A sorting domain-containing protein [Flavobacteriaceae bacterium]